MFNLGPFLILFAVALGLYLLAQLAGWVFDQDDEANHHSDTI